MKIQNYFASSAFSFLSEIQSIETRTKKIALLAIAAFSLLAACYFAYSYVFLRKKDSPANPQDQKTPLANDKSPANIKAETSHQSKQKPQLKHDPVLIDSPISPFKPLPVQLSPKTPMGIPESSRPTHTDKENKRLGKVEQPIPFQQTAVDPKGKLGVATPLQTQGVEKVTVQKEERKEIVYLFSPYNFGSTEQILSNTFPGIAEIKTSLEKTYQQVVFTSDPQIVKKGAPVLFFLGKNPRFDLSTHDVIQTLERLGSNVLVLIFEYANSNHAPISREGFKDFLKPVNDGPGKGMISAPVVEKYRNFESFLIFEYFTAISNTGVGDPIITRKFKGNPNPAQEILKKLQEMEQKGAAQLRIPEDKEDRKPLAKVEQLIPFQQPTADPKDKHGALTPLQTQRVEKVTQQKEERQEIIYLFSPNNFLPAEQLLSDTYPGIAEIKTALEKNYQQVVFTHDPQIVKGAPVLFFLGKNTRIDLHNSNVIQILESLGNNVLILLFDQNNPNFASYPREDFKDFLKPESINEGPGKGTIAADVLEKYRNFDSFLIFEYSVSFSNTGVNDVITKKFRGNMNPAQEILRKLQEMEKNAVHVSHSGKTTARA